MSQARLGARHRKAALQRPDHLRRVDFLRCTFFTKASQGAKRAKAHALFMKGPVFLGIFFDKPDLLSKLKTSFSVICGASIPNLKFVAAL